MKTFDLSCINRRPAYALDPSLIVHGKNQPSLIQLLLLGLIVPAAYVFPDREKLLSGTVL